MVVVILPIMILGAQTAFADNDQPTSPHLRLMWSWTV
jgi:hypothetical protein